MDSLLQEKLRQMGEEPGRELMVSLERFRQKLQSTEVGILIDNLESTLDAAGCFIEEHRSYIELMRILSDSSLRGFSIITSRESLNEPSISLDSYKLKGLSFKAWKGYFEYQSVMLEEQQKSLIEMHDAFGGNAKAMDVLSKAIQQDYTGNLQAYWQSNRDNLLIEPTLENLVKEQFKRLKELNLIDAYNLLCRLGCYRYQDIPVVAEKGLYCLLWDAENNQAKKAIKTLKKRGLIEFQDNQYYLHPIIREESIARLRKSKDWNKANVCGAIFWLNSISKISTIKDALIAFESYYHYLNNQDFARAASLIADKEIPIYNQVEKESLGVIFYQFGLLENIKRGILGVLKQIPVSKTLAVLNNLLGDVYWMTGELHKAIEQHSQCMKLSKELNIGKTNKNPIFHRLNHLYVVSWFNIALCHIDLWELIEAETNLHNTIEFSLQLNTPKRHQVIAYFALSYIYSEMGEKKKASQCLLKINFDEYSNGYLWGIGYSLLFYGLSQKKLGNEQESCIAYQKALSFSKEFNYPQVKAKALTGLAELKRNQNKFNDALVLHRESITILERIGAKCDLTEAYFQCALTYQKMRDEDNSQTYFDKALYLWSPEQINAPKQIERVKKAMNQ